ncbi:MAG: M6 family metalloprotease domain-containing protein, partial [Candidatus Zixiibacteriota bacterium]
MKNLLRLTTFLCQLVLFFGLIIDPVSAVPPSPELELQLAAGKKPIPYYLEHYDEIHQKGVCEPDKLLLRPRSQNNGAQLSSSAAPFRVLAIIVKFSDHDSSVSAPFFDSMVFSSSGSTVRNYFSEISYTQIDLVTLNNPSALGWRTAPQSYAYYTDSASGLGSYPRNTQKLVEDIVDQVDPLVNFAQYDNNSDGKVDCLLMIHSGTGAEFSGSNNDIWSHKWAITPRLKDGVTISSYTAQPEFWSLPGDMTIGVYSHELLHGFGLPDLYDTDFSSNGIGKWCVMAYGCWNGPGSRGGSPSHPCAWSRIELGFATATNVTSNMYATVIDNVNQNSTIYRLWNSGNIG